MFVTANEGEAIERAAKVLHQLRPHWSESFWVTFIEEKVADLADREFGDFISSAGVTVTRMKWEDEPDENSYTVDLNIAEIFDNDEHHFVFDPKSDPGGQDISDRFPPKYVADV